MMRIFTSYLLAVTLCMLVVVVDKTAASQQPAEQLRPFIDKIVTILKENHSVSGQNQDKVDRIMDAAREGFDFKEMSKRVLGKKWRKLSPVEKAKFEQLFTQLLKYAYVSQMDKYSNQRIEIGNQRVKGKRAEVKTLLVSGDKQVPVSYIMLLKEDQWKVYDIVIEGVSLVRNYLVQFQEILRKEDFAGLTRQMETKIAELRQGSATG